MSKRNLSLYDIYRKAPLSRILFNDMPPFFDNGLIDQGEQSVTANSEWCPSVDIKETQNAFVVHADVPGVEPNTIEVSMENNVLSIRGHREFEKNDKDENYTRIERFSGRFERNFLLPKTANSENITAKSKHGVLEITIPKISMNQSKKIKVDVES